MANIRSELHLKPWSFDSRVHRNARHIKYSFLRPTRTMATSCKHPSTGKVFTRPVYERIRVGDQSAGSNSPILFPLSGHLKVFALVSSISEHSRRLLAILVVFLDRNWVRLGIYTVPVYVRKSPSKSLNDINTKDDRKEFFVPHVTYTYLYYM